MSSTASYSIVNSSDNEELVHWIFRAFTVVEVILIFGSFFIVTICFYVFTKIPLFHKNMMRLFITLLIHFNFIMVLRIIMIFQEFVSNSKVEVVNFLNANYIIVGENGQFSYVGWVRSFFLIAIYANLGNFVLERVYATIQLESYEKNVSNKFFVFCIAYQLFPAIIIAYLFLQDALTIEVCGIGVLAANIFGYIILVFLEYFNKKRYRISLYNVSRYTLSERFQLQENIRAAHLMKRVTVIIVSIHLLIGIAFLLSYFFDGYIFRRSCYCFFNLALVLYAYVFVLVGITSNEAWKNLLVRTLLRISKVGPSEIPTQSPRNHRKSLGNHVRGFDGQRIIFTIDEEREMYFNQLHKYWN